MIERRSRRPIQMEKESHPQSDTGLTTQLSGYGRPRDLSMLWILCRVGRERLRGARGVVPCPRSLRPHQRWEALIVMSIGEEGLRTSVKIFGDVLIPRDGLCCRAWCEASVLDSPPPATVNRHPSQAGPSSSTPAPVNSPRHNTSSSLAAERCSVESPLSHTGNDSDGTKHS